MAGVEKPLAHHRLNSAVDEVRTEWCQARTEAMRSGRTYAFRYQVGGDHYYTELESGLNGNASEGDSPLVSSAAAGAPSAASSNAAGPMDNKTLPKGVKFSAEQPSQSTTTPAAATPSQDQPAGGWSDPIFFYPDGTASDVQLVLICNQRLRGARYAAREHSHGNDCRRRLDLGVAPCERRVSPCWK